MPSYTIKLVCEAGTGPLGEGPFERAEELVVVEAPTPWEAFQAATRRMTISPMGRLLIGYDASTGQEVSPPAPGPWRRGQFVLEGLKGSYEGFTRGETWNGWAVPCFDQNIARRIARDYVEAEQAEGRECRAWYDEGEDCFVFYDSVYDEEIAYYAMEIAGPRGAPRAVYPLGSNEWTWSEAL